MPVLVTVEQDAVGRAVVERLVRGGGEVRAYMDAERGGSHAALTNRVQGVKTAVGTLDDEGRLETACAQVHTVVHVGAGLLTPPDRLVDDLAVVCSAAIGAGCRRVIWPSHLGAAAPGDSAWLAACAEGEQLLAEAPLETVVLRTGLVYGPRDPLTDALRDGALTGRVEGACLQAPLWAADLAEAVAAADTRTASAAQDLHLVVALAGPEVVRLDALVAALGGPPLAGRVRARAAGRVPDHAVDVLRRDAVGDPSAVGRQGTRLAQGVALVAGSASP